MLQKYKKLRDQECLVNIPILVSIKVNPYSKLLIKSIYCVGGSPEFFHTDTKSVDKAIPIINEAILFLKSLIEKKRIEKANEDFK